MTIAYDGTHYCGWQIQPNGQSIQEIIQNALKIVLRLDQINLIGSGRTDAGVHALGQVANFQFAYPLDRNRTLYSLNGLIPPDIRINSLEIVDADFHARYSAIGKEYHYHLYLDRILDPFKRLYCWHLHKKIDPHLLRKACQRFLGQHDFSAFANEAHAGAAAKNPIRTIYRLDSIEERGGLRLEFEGDGFLYKMVRNMMGMIVDVASGKRDINDIERVLFSRDRKQASASAPPQGLFLIKVNYPST